ncbi:hypothetical protein [Edaphovirga cremea]|uniref:hypothetical protein n=1 Tax=Edaphovirga cremea TaxID=2267246 RepID=UPI003989B1AE
MNKVLKFFLITFMILAVIGAFVGEGDKKTAESAVATPTKTPKSPEPSKTSESSRCPESDGECIFNANLPEASYPCKRQIERLSKYDYEWNDGIFGLAFTHFRNIPDKGLMVFTGDKVKFTNGFNAKVNMIYSCTYDLKSKSVVDVTVKEGRL